MSQTTLGSWGRILATALAVLAVSAASGLAQGAAPPEAVVRERNVAVQELLEAAGDTVTEATREELKDVINGLIDFDELSRRALRRHWDDRTPEEREQFTEVFRELVRNSSVQKPEIYKADSVDYRTPELDGDEARVVTVAHRGSSEVEIEYLMHRIDGEWKAYDVIIEGSSTLRTYQDSFQREISATSYQAMYDRMVERLGRDRPGTRR